MMLKLVNSFLRLGGVELLQLSDSTPSFIKLHDKYRNYTMLHEEAFVNNLRVVNTIRHLAGDVVECGVWRGGMIAAIGEIFDSNRRYFLFDSFEGLPDAKAIDGQAAIAWQKDVDSLGFYDNCRAERSDAIEAISMSGIKDYKILEGWFEKTVPFFNDSNQIAVLRLDGDWYDSTIVCLEHLFPKVIEGGIIIIDDYYAWDGCAKAVHEYLAKVDYPYRIKTLNGTVYIKKSKKIYS